MTKPNASLRVLQYLVILIVMFLYLFPLANLVNASLKDPTSFLMNPTGVVKHLDVGNYVQAWKRGHFGHYLWNSIYYTAFATVLSLALALLAAFPISRKYTKGANFFYLLFMSGMFLPNGMIPQFVLMLNLGLYNTPFSFILTNVNFFFVFLLMVGYIKSIPIELDSAASVDGCGYFRFLFTIILPLIQPVMATGAIMVAINVWNNIIGSVIYFSDEKLYPIVRGLFAFYGKYSNEWTVLAAAILTVSIPLVILYVSLQKYFVQGALAGAVKS